MGRDKYLFVFNASFERGLEMVDTLIGSWHDYGRAEISGFQELSQFCPRDLAGGGVEQINGNPN